jgi:chorismate dehydratase
MKVTAVSYLNTKPFLYGIFKSGLEEEIELSLDIPSECARKLVTGEADMGLVPVAVIPELPESQVISDYCIGSAGAVKTVCIFGDCPIEEMTHLYLDYHSRTSVELVKILLENYWKRQPRLLPATPGFESKIEGTAGGLVIGDRAIAQGAKHPYIYDLGEAWQEHTGLPFVFAAWVSRRPPADDFLARFNAALRLGIEHIPQLMYLLPAPQPGFDLQRYFTENISYELDEKKRQGLDLFLSSLKVEKLEGAVS